MANVFDVADYILQERGALPAKALHALVFYSQAWHLVWEGGSICPEPVEAWAAGPIVPELYTEHRGLFQVGRLPKGDSACLSEVERDTVDRVLTFYKKFSPRVLVAIAKQENPWREASPDRAVITPEAMRAYYASL